MADVEVGYNEGDNVDVTHTSGCSRLANSLLTAFCIAPLVVMACCFVLGWNEKRAVCDMRAIAQGKDEVVTTECNSASSGNGDLVQFTCDLQRAELPTWSGDADFASNLTFKGLGLKQEVEMYQCVETSRSETTKDSVGGGTTTVTVYSYSKEWRSTHVNSGNFKKKFSDNFRRNCNEENPIWPSWAPRNSVQYASTAKIGNYTVKGSFLESVPLDDPLMASAVPANWNLEGSWYKRPSGTPRIGTVRARFYGNDWAKPTMTVLGLNSAGTIGQWTAGDSWLCSGFTLGTLRVGTQSKDTLFKALEAENNALTYVLRFIALLLMWLGFSLFFKPLEVATDCIPCIGPYLGDSVACITCCIACPMACACALGVAGTVWVVMRPLVGGVMMVIFLCACVGMSFFIIQSKTKKKSAPEPTSAAEPTPTTVGEPVA